jgi:hypothetical protein
MSVTHLLTYAGINKCENNSRRHKETRPNVEKPFGKTALNFFSGQIDKQVSEFQAMKLKHKKK